jgi:hypothetical protein
LEHCLSPEIAHCNLQPSRPFLSSTVHQVDLHDTVRNVIANTSAIAHCGGQYEVRPDDGLSLFFFILRGNVAWFPLLGDRPRALPECGDCWACPTAADDLVAWCFTIITTSSRDDRMEVSRRAGRLIEGYIVIASLTKGNDSVSRFICPLRLVLSLPRSPKVQHVDDLGKRLVRRTEQVRRQHVKRPGCLDQ